MKVIAINGSARKDGNTANLINRVLNELTQEGIEYELVHLSGKKIKGCIACMKCFENQDKLCARKNDDVNDIIEKMSAADGIILGSPTYFANVSTETKAIIDRAGMVSIANGHMLKRKVGAAVVAVRRAGAVQVFDAINHFYLINQVIVPGSRYWNMGYGMEKNEVDKDEEGIQIMKDLGSNMAWLLKKITK